ncbi:MAG: carboxymuconolactone decarboxylase family protein [Permianibacter sp.]
MSTENVAIETLRAALPEAARDTKLNLGTVLTSDGAPDLNDTQIWSIALAVAYASKNDRVATAVEADARHYLDDVHVNAARTAATVMAMNNVYYRFLHLAGDAELSKLPARLRMNGLANHGIAKLDFELMALAVSAVNGCGMCIESHVHEVSKQGASKLAIQSSVRIAAVLVATAQALSLPQ